MGLQIRPCSSFSPNGSGGWNSTVIHTFAGYPNDGFRALGTPVLDKAGNLYGTTYQGGTTNNGTVYKLSPGPNGEWTEEILHSFRAVTVAPILWRALRSMRAETFTEQQFWEVAGVRELFSS